jgi:hypothetical protein
MAPSRVRPKRETKQAPIPERFHYDRSWSTAGPDGAEVDVELWTTQSGSEALARHSELILGTAPAGKEPVEPDELAVALHGEKWVREQLHTAQKKLAGKP